MRGFFQITAVVLTLSSFGAVSAHAGDSEILGTGVGAALGGLLGSQFGHGDGRLAATGLGVFTGGLIGNSVGASVDRSSRGYSGGGYSGGYAYAPSYVPPTYSTPNYVTLPAPPPRVVYSVPNEVVVMPAQSPDYTEAPVYMDSDYDEGDDPRYCRQFTQRVLVNGRLQEAYGTACLQPDGSWRVER